MEKHSKKIEWVGHGGVRCPCCRPRGYSTKEFKRLLSRTERRNVRIALAGLAQRTFRLTDGSEAWQVTGAEVAADNAEHDPLLAWLATAEVGEVWDAGLLVERVS